MSHSMCPFRKVQNTHIIFKYEMKYALLIFQVAELLQIGVDVTVLGIDQNDGSQVIIGEGRTSFFFQTRPNVIRDLYAHHSLSKYFFYVYTIAPIFLIA